MNAIEFSGKLDHGMIRLPKQYEAYDNAFVRVIVLVQNPDSVDEKKERLRLALQKLGNANAFAGIEDPLSWQKNLRDEWK